MFLLRADPTGGGTGHGYIFNKAALFSKAASEHTKPAMGGPRRPWSVMARLGPTVASLPAPPNAHRPPHPTSTPPRPSPSFYFRKGTLCGTGGGTSGAPVGERFDRYFRKGTSLKIFEEGGKIEK